MTQACIIGAYEHPTRKADGLSLARLHADVAIGAAKDAGVALSDIDGYFCAGDPGLGGMAMAEYIGLTPRHIDSTDIGGASYVLHVAHAAQAIAAGKCNMALITLAGRPRAAKFAAGTAPRAGDDSSPERQFEAPYAMVTASGYALCAARHMYEYGTTAEQLAWIKVAASQHAQYNPDAMLPDPVTVEEVVNSPLISDPLHRLDCCVISDGGGALIVARPEIAAQLNRPTVALRGAGEAIKTTNGGALDLTCTAAALSGPRAFEEAGVTPADIRYASVYDSFTITVLLQLEDLGFCEKGKGGAFVADGALISGQGKLAWNTDGGGLCNNHPSNRGGMTKVIEAVRQLRGEAHPKVQVPDLDLALVQGMGGNIGTRHGSATLILERLN